MGLARHVTKHAVTVMDPARSGGSWSGPGTWPPPGAPGRSGSICPWMSRRRWWRRTSSPFAASRPRIRRGRNPRLRGAARWRPNSAGPAAPWCWPGNGVHWARAEARAAGPAGARRPSRWCCPTPPRTCSGEEHPCNMGVFGTAGPARGQHRPAERRPAPVPGLGPVPVQDRLQPGRVRAPGPEALRGHRSGPAPPPDHQPDLAVQADLAGFLTQLLRELDLPATMDARWLEACDDWRSRYPAVAPSTWRRPNR